MFTQKLLGTDSSSLFNEAVLKKDQPLDRNIAWNLFYTQVAAVLDAVENFFSIIYNRMSYEISSPIIQVCSFPALEAFSLKSSLKAEEAFGNFKNSLKASVVTPLIMSHQITATVIDWATISDRLTPTGPSMEQSKSKKD